MGQAKKQLDEQLTKRRKAAYSEPVKPEPLPVPAEAVGLPDQSASTIRLLKTSQSLLYLLSRDDGYLRLIPSGQIIYAKWKFTAGKYRGFYVMWQGWLGEIPDLLFGLCEKVRAVDMGVGRLSKDKPAPGWTELEGYVSGECDK